MSGKQGEWRRIGVNGWGCEGECMGHSLGDEPLTFMIMTQLYEAFGWKSLCD